VLVFQEIKDKFVGEWSALYRRIWRYEVMLM